MFSRFSMQEGSLGGREGGFEGLCLLASRSNLMEGLYYILYSCTECNTNNGCGSFAT